MERKMAEVIHIVLEQCKHVCINSGRQVALAHKIFIMAPIFS
jgi:hypothetical protein